MIKFVFPIISLDLNFYESCTDELLHPQIVTPLPLSVQKKFGSELQLLCLLTGYPPMEIEWYIAGEKISIADDERFELNNNGRGLIIKRLRTEDSGPIMFRAVNKYGDVTSSCLLQVTGVGSRQKTSFKKRSLKMLSTPSMKNRLNKVFGKTQ